MKYVREYITVYALADVVRKVSDISLPPFGLMLPHALIVCNEVSCSTDVVSWTKKMFVYYKLRVLETRLSGVVYVYYCSVDLVIIASTFVKGKRYYDYIIQVRFVRSTE